MTDEHHPKDYVQAHQWMSLARDQGERYEWEAARDLTILEPKMTSDQIAEAQRHAREWRERHEKTE